ncbi:MAG TPA: hypothetical protein VGR35_05825 [Tepidisphaeraceae bacterium]|nr:hypothetical protein [Tepidisphaeraceae bacterium]
MNDVLNDQTSAVAAMVVPWLLKHIDRYDWAFRRRDGTFQRQLTNDQLADWRNQKLGWWPQKLGPKVLKAHLREKDEIHYVSARKSGFALLCIDVDAHDGQTDAFEAVQLLFSHFPGCYVEPSRRGYHMFLLIDVGPLPRQRFNELVIRFRRAASATLLEGNIASTVEVKGDFTTFFATPDCGDVLNHRASTCRLPRPANVEQARALVQSPVYTPQDMEGFIAETREEEQVFLLEAIEKVRKSRGEKREQPHNFDDQNAQHRMYIAFFEYTVQYRTEPDRVELLEFYRARWSAGPSHARREERAEWVIQNSQFDPAKLGMTGYEKQREELLELVRAHVKAEHKTGLSYRYEIPEEDLAVALWVVVGASFERVDVKWKQFGCPIKRFVGAFQALRKDGVINRGCTSTTKISSIKLILARAGLIQCLDNSYSFVPGKPGLGCGKKYAIGPHHPRFAEWRRVRPSLEDGVRLAAA